MNIEAVILTAMGMIYSFGSGWKSIILRMS
jgi:hypothetical protein